MLEATALPTDPQSLPNENVTMSQSVHFCIVLAFRLSGCRGHKKPQLQAKLNHF